MVNWAGAANEMLEIVIQLGNKIRIVTIFFIGLIQFFQRAIKVSAA